MDCLRDYIGILGCDAPEPTSGRYVNDLPGISTYILTKINGREEPTFLNVWEKIQTRALKKFASAVISEFNTSKKYRIKTIADLVDLGKILSDSDPLANAAQYRGFSVELMFPPFNKSNSVYSLQSSLQVIFIQSLKLYSPDDVENVAIKIFDLDTGETLDAFTVDVVEGWNTVNVFKSYDALRILVGYNSTNIDSSELNIQRFYSSCQHGCDMLYGAGECEAYVRGAITPNLSDVTEIEQGNNSYGLSGVFSIQCRYDWIVCGNLQLFENAWLYLLGAELATQILKSDRDTPYTLGVGREKAEENLADWTAEYQKELKTAITGIDINRYDCCIECEAQIQKPYVIP